MEHEGSNPVEGLKAKHATTQHQVSLCPLVQGVTIGPAPGVKGAASCVVLAETLMHCFGAGERQQDWLASAGRNVEELVAVAAKKRLASGKAIVVLHPSDF